MEFDEVVLSEVHFNTNNEQPEKQITRNGCKIFHSRFLIRLPMESESEEEQTLDNSHMFHQLDEDGDLILVRETPKVSHMEVITLEHTLSSYLHLVGLQVWLGSLLLSDFILHNWKEFENSTVLELGAGVGLCSIVAAITAKTVFSTDADESILDTCLSNSQRNQHLFRHQLPLDGGIALNQDVIRVRELDWTKGLICPGNGTLYSWSEEDRIRFQECSVLLAADVIYDNNLTKSFFQTIHSIMKIPPQKVLYIAIERRLNFTLAEMDVSCIEYDYFITCLQDLQQESFDDQISYSVMQLKTDFPIFFHDIYKRTNFLELWKVSTTNKESVVRVI